MAEVGKLNVKLTGDDSSLRRTTKQAEGRLTRFSSRVKDTMRKNARAFAVAGAAMGAAVAAVSEGLRRTMSEMDRLTKLSRSIGVPVEELSGLAHAAGLSGLQVKELGRGLRNFSRNAAAAAKGPTDFTRSLEAIEVEWQNADGTFRNSRDVMLDVADKFKRMEDGSNKTALAMKIFGEEVGPRMVTMLNQGSEGIEQMTEEADRMGLTFSQKAGRAAEAFNDTISKVGGVVKGLFTRLAIDLAPALQDAATRMLEWAKSSQTLQAILTGIGATIKVLISAVKAAVGIFDQLRIVVLGTLEAIGAAATLNFTKAGEIIKQTSKDMAESAVGSIQSIAQTWGLMAEQQKAAAEGFANEVAPLMTEGLSAVSEAERARNEAMREGIRLMEEMRTPEEEMIARQKRINELKAQGAIDAQTYGRAMAQASTFSAKNMQALASQVSNALGVIFKDSKAAAIAQAVINTAQGVTKAIATYPPPLSGIMAGIQAAMGAAQIAAIKSTTQSGGGSSPSVSGGGSAPAPASPGGGGSGRVDQRLLVQGIGSDDLFTGDMVRGLAEKLLDFQEQGGKVVLQ